MERQRHATLARWELTPSWENDEKIAPHTFNARAATVPDIPSFSAAFKRHRCKVPAPAFYEWRTVPGQTKKLCLRFEAADGQPLGFAGRWQRPETGETYASYAIINTTTNGFMAPIHNRMPVLFADADVDVWLDPDENNPLLLASLQKPPADYALKLIEPTSPAAQWINPLAHTEKLMSKSIPDATPRLNRLRAAAGLIAIIEDGLVKGTLTRDRASVMAAFCAWAHDQPCEDADTQALTRTISDGLERIESMIAAQQEHVS